MLRRVENTLALHTMLYPDEIVAASGVEGLPVRVKTDARELKMASQLVHRGRKSRAKSRSRARKSA